MPEDNNGKIAEITPEHIEGFGTKYQPDQFTPEALKGLLTSAVQDEGTPAQDTPPEVPVQPAESSKEPAPAAPETPAKDDRKPLKQELYDTKNALNQIQQKFTHQQKLLERFQADPDEFIKWSAKQRGESVDTVAKRFHREADGSIDLADIRNQRAVTETTLEVVKDTGELHARLAQLEQTLQQRDQMEAQRRELGQIDEMLSSYGAEEALGEKFSEAETKYAEVYYALSVQKEDGTWDSSKVDRFITDPNFRAQYPNLKLPKNVEAYQKVVEARRVAQASPAFDLGTLLQAAGVTGKAKPATIVTPEQVDAQRALEKKLAVQQQPTLPPGNPPMQDKDPAAQAEAFIFQLSAKPEGQWTDADRAKLKALLKTRD